MTNEPREIAMPTCADKGKDVTLPLVSEELAADQLAESVETIMSCGEMMHSMLIG